MDERTRKALFSHETVEWFTPRHIYDRYNSLFHFRIDPCTSPSNPLGCEIFFTKDQDGLRQEWPEGNVWINPPCEGRNNEKWVAKARDHAQAGKGTVVMLLPSKTETIWFQRYVWNKETGSWYDGVKVEFLTPRIRFTNTEGKCKDNPTFGSVIVIFYPPPPPSWLPGQSFHAAELDTDSFLFDYYYHSV